ncbi:MAG: ABC transporter permease [Chitinophagales bacterium]|nr:ABC transporter permease [Chitinophagales bacterium]
MKNINTDIATTYLITSKKMTLVAVLGVLIGMAIYISMNCLLSGFDEVSNEWIFKSTPHIRIYKDDVISRPLVESEDALDIIVNPKIVPASKTITNPQEIISTIKKQEDITVITPVITTTVFYNMGKSQVPGTVTGVHPFEADQMFKIKSSIIEGQFDKLKWNVNSIVLGVELAQKLNLSIGDNVNITSSKGVSRNLQVVATFKTSNALKDKSTSYINLEMAQQLLRENTSYITDINVNIPDPEQAVEMSKKLSLLTGYKAESWQKANETVMAAFRMRRIVITFVSFTVLIVAGFGIYNILNMTVSQKINDIAILKAIGFKGKDVIRIFLTQALSIGFLGVMGGVITSIIIISFLKTVL